MSKKTGLIILAVVLAFSGILYFFVKTPEVEKVINYGLIGYAGINGILWFAALITNVFSKALAEKIFFIFRLVLILLYFVGPLLLLYALADRTL